MIIICPDDCEHNKGIAGCDSPAIDALIERMMINSDRFATLQDKICDCFCPLLVQKKDWKNPNPFCK